MAAQEDLTALSLDDLKKKRKTARQNITAIHKRIFNIVAERGSRTTLVDFISRITFASQLGEAANDLIVAQMEEDEGAGELEKQLEYTQKANEAIDLGNQHVDGRQNEAPSVIGQQVRVPSSVASSETNGQGGQGSQHNGQVSQHGGQGQQGGQGGQPITTTTDQAQKIAQLEKQIQQLLASRPTQKKTAPAPDDWINDYVEGRQPIEWWNEAGRSSACKIELEKFDGNALRWFMWVDLFKSLVHDAGSSVAEKMAILRSKLDGDCADVVYGLGGGEDAYKEALRRLKAEYGRRDVMRAAHIGAISRLEPGKGPSGLKHYAEKVRNHLFDLKRIGEDVDPDLIERITSKLAVQDRVAWNEVKRGLADKLDLDYFGRWLCDRASSYLNAFDLADEQGKKSAGLSSSSKSNKTIVRTNHTSASSGPNPSKRSCPSCSESHHLRDCSSFKSLSIGRRIEFLTGKGICFYCLYKGHMVRQCRQAKVCGKGGCTLRHHELLHEDSPPPTVVSSHHSSGSSNPTRVAFGTLSVEVLDSKGQPVIANILFDECSDGTLVREGFVNRLGLTGAADPLVIKGVTGARSNHSSQCIELQIKTADGSYVKIEAKSVKKVCDPVPTVQWSSVKKNWKHLADLPLADMNGRVDILLGLAYGVLMLPSDKRVGRDDEPFAIKNRFGWVGRGAVNNSSRTTEVRTHLTMLAFEDRLDEQLRRLCDTENFGCERPEEMKLAPDDEFANRTVEEGTKQSDGGYEVALPWRIGEPAIPSNKKLAEFRFQSLLKRFEKDPEFESDYRQAMAKYFEKGYAHIVADPAELAHPEQGFLPHFGVRKRHGDNKKIRIVFDSAAKFEGKCLNDCLLTGPPLQNLLPHVLIRFREGAVAFSADIEAMFSRIRLTPRDARYHRFLWQDDNKKTVVCQMDRLTFGDGSSPFVALKTIRRVAADHGAGKEDAVRTIHRNLYVDDYLDSAKSVEEAVKRATDVRDILAAGDFPLVGWKANCDEFLRVVDPSSTSRSAEEHSLGEDEMATRVLGVNWLPASDVFVFRFCFADFSFTRRWMASLTAGMFDPLGLLSPVIVKAKIRLRELAVRGIGFDDEMPEQDQRWWESFISRLPELRRYQTPRVLFPNEDSIRKIELHTFSDSSEEAFAAAVYLRLTYEDESVVVRLVMAKSKLTPMKTVSVAKNELNGAVLGARLAAFVQQAITRPIHARFFWTDSSCVRNWIRSTSAFYKPFVSQRIGEIQTLTKAEEWRFVPGKLNVSDYATRSSIETPELIELTWFNGPEFLHYTEDRWPADIPWISPADEVRPVYEHRVLHTVTESRIDWSTLELDPTETAGHTRIEGRLLVCIRQCQQEAFATEIEQLRADEAIRRSSKILCLTPFLDPDGLLRVGGRIGRVELPYDNKHPVILPAKHPLTSLIIWEFHRRLLHTGTDHVLSHLRQHYWIVNGREIVKGIRRRCRQCREEFARPVGQMMADLPKERLDFGKPPFHHTCVDYFGPLEVSYGRNKSAKRYGVLFACLVTRAVYLDLAQSLSTSDFLLVYHRFTSIYGKPATIWSDNGTNFVGAEKEMREYVEQISKDPKFQSQLVAVNTTWKFQPPNAPHFGGAHESLVRSAKSILYRAFKAMQQNHHLPSEEVLQTLLFQTASLLNERPLGYVSADSADVRPLTPNDFMNRSPSSIVAPVAADLCALPKDGVKYVRRTLQVIWDLWQKHYLPSLVARKKWLLKKRNLQVGDPVLIAEKNPLIGSWTSGRVVAVHPGSDGLVRVADVETSSGTYRRPVHLLCPLESSLDQPGSADRGQDVPAK